MSAGRRLLFVALGFVSLLPFVDEAFFAVPWHLPAFFLLFVLVLAFFEPPKQLSFTRWLEQLRRRLTASGRE